jgi:nitrate reductase gamma subunit
MEFSSTFLYVGLPYIAMAVFLVGTVHRSRSRSFSVSSLSSQFLEGKDLFWGAIPFHVGILVALAGHLLAFLIPEGTLLWNSEPARLIALEVTGFAFGLSALVGLCALLFRRVTNARVRMVSNRMDYVLEVLLLAQIVLGLWIALTQRWGSSWFAADMSPYLMSLFTFSPKIGAVAAMPLVIRLHVIGAFVILGIFPFTRLVHFVVAPLHYVVRPYQRVIWNWNRKTARDPRAPWSEARPKNN